MNLDQLSITVAPGLGFATTPPDISQRPHQYEEIYDPDHVSQQSDHYEEICVAGDVSQQPDHDEEICDADDVSQQQPDHYEEICDTGDVILLVGSEKKPLKVQSRCLRTASKVFDTMFGPSWKEGQDLSEDDPKPIDLDDDDFRAMYIVCCVVHHRNDLLTRSLDPADVLRVAIVVDKYDLSVAMKFALDQWLKLRDNMDMIQLGYMMAAVHRLQDAARFLEATLALITRCATSYWCLAEHNEINGVLSAETSGKVLYLLEERRNRMRVDILHILGSRGPGCSCGWGQEYARNREKLQDDYGPLDLLRTPLVQIISRLESIPLGDLSEPKRCGDAWSDGDVHRLEETPQNKISIMKKAAEISLEDIYEKTVAN